MTFSYHFNLQHFKKDQIVYDKGDFNVNMLYFVCSGEFMIQGIMEEMNQDCNEVPFKKKRKKMKVINIEILPERAIFGLEYFNRELTEEFLKFEQSMMINQNVSLD